VALCEFGCQLFSYSQINSHIVTFGHIFGKIFFCNGRFGQRFPIHFQLSLAHFQLTSTQLNSLKPALTRLNSHKMNFLISQPAIGNMSTAGNQGAFALPLERGVYAASSCLSGQPRRSVQTVRILTRSEDRAPGTVRADAPAPTAKWKISLLARLENFKFFEMSVTGSAGPRSYP
jgi:hypothetical protein